MGCVSSASLSGFVSVSGRVVDETLIPRAASRTDAAAGRDVGAREEALFRHGGTDERTPLSARSSTSLDSDVLIHVHASAHWFAAWSIGAQYAICVISTWPARGCSAPGVWPLVLVWKTNH
jgi:hypothetical protein